MNRQLVNTFILLVVLTLQVHSCTLKPFLPLFYLWCCSCEKIYQDLATFIIITMFVGKPMNKANVHLHVQQIVSFLDLTHFTLWLMFTNREKSGMDGVHVRAHTHTHTHIHGSQCHLATASYGSGELRHGTCHFYTIYTGVSNIGLIDISGN